MGAALAQTGSERPIGESPRGRLPEERTGEATQPQVEVPSPYQLRQTPPLLSQPGAVNPKTYRLGPGDLLQLDMWGRVARSVALEVSPEGKIFLPGSGPLNVSGQTLEWAQGQALGVIGNTFRGVSADLRLVRLRTFKVYVAGAVARPGPLEVTSVTRASEALVRADLNPNASRRNVAVRHLSGTTDRVDLQLFEATGRQSFDPILMDGDVLTVAVAKDFVYLYGALALPGQFELVDGDSLSGMIQMAGGLLSAASTDSGLIVRFTREPSVRESLHVDLAGLLAGHWDLRLQDGDRFFVYYQRDYHVLPTVEILGEINRPGGYPIILGHDRLSDLVTWAGGFSPRANTSGIYVVRAPEGLHDDDPEFDRISRLSRDQMTSSEYVAFQTKLAQRRGSFIVDWSTISGSPGNKDLDPLLGNGDLIRVDPLVTSIRVQGAVRHPGLVEYVPKRSVGEYIHLAGGYTERAAAGQVRVSRSLTGHIVPAQDVRSIEPGDFIWVPERKEIDTWAIFRDVMIVAGQVALIYVAFFK
jgi:protein involved in polysaccharide export with SLBB domain